ncbi:MAG: glycosyltransferase family 39 protein [Chloroflexi bacterium]|nr:glycosyltransferase family 39 protein [Chloroflexota bacterium]
MNATRLSFPLPSLQTTLTLIAIVLAATAQYAHTFLQANLAARVLFAIALVIWLGAIMTSRVALDTWLDATQPPVTSPRRPSLGFAVAAVALALVTFFTSKENTFTLDNLAPWLLSIAVFLYAFWEREKSWPDWQAWLRQRIEQARAAFRDGWRVSSRVVALTFIILIGVFFYFHNLDGVPGEMDSDHAEKILDVNDVVNGGLRPIFFERNTGREPLEFYLIAALVQFGGQPLDHMALKLVTATMGLLVIPGVYFLARELFDEQTAGIAAALVAIGKWPVTIARMGLRFPFTPVFIAPLLYFLFRALKYQRRNDFLMTGLFLGAGLYGYNAFRIAPVLVAVFLLIWLFVGRRMDRVELRRFITNSILVFAFALIIFAPLLRYSVDHPGEFWYRVLTRLSSEERTLEGNPIQTFARNELNAALMFNWRGDEAWPNSIPGDPALDYVSGGLFLLGVVYALYRLARYRERAYAFILIGLLIMLLPSALSLAFPNENPSNARAGGAIPFVFLIAALPIAWLAREIKQSAPSVASGVAVLVLFAAIAGVNYVRYFRDFDQNYRLSSWNSSEVARVIKNFAESVGDYGNAYIMLYAHWVDTRNVAINMGRIGWDQTLPNIEAVLVGAPRGTENRLFVLNPNDTGALARLEELMPNGQMRVFQSRTPGKNFILWYVPGTIAPDTPLTSK